MNNYSSFVGDWTAKGEAMMNDNETVVFVEFDGKHPYRVVTLEHGKHRPILNDYDFAWSKKYGLLYHASGSMSVRPLEPGQSVKENADGSHTPIETVYWATSDIEVKEPPLCKRLATLPEAYTAESLFDMCNTIECDAIIWCSECQDWFPDKVEDYCEHVWWCNICEDISTPDERCEHEEGAE